MLLGMPLDQHRLRYFVAIAESGSLSGAARRLHVAQPALSHHMALMERQLGVRLFTRHSRGVRLTEPGARLLTHARGILKGIDDAYADLRGLAAGRGRRLTLGLLSAPALFLIPQILRAVAGIEPTLHVDIVEGDSELLRRLVRDGQLDLAFNLADPAQPGAEVIASEVLYVAGPPGTDGRPRPTMPFREVIARPLILPGPHNSLRKLVEQEAARLNHQVLVAMQIDGVAPMQQAISSGFGHTVTSWPVIQENAARGNLHISRIVEPELVRTFVLQHGKAERAGMRGARLQLAALLRRTLDRCRQEVGWPRACTNAPAREHGLD